MSNTRRQHYQNHRLRLGTEIWSLRWSPNSVWYTRVHGTRGRELWLCVASNGHVEHRGHMLCAVSVPFQNTSIYIKYTRSSCISLLENCMRKRYRVKFNSIFNRNFKRRFSSAHKIGSTEYASIVFSSETLNIPRLSLLKQWSPTFWIKIGST